MNKCNKHISLVMVFLLILFTFSGCSFAGINAQNLMTAPKFNPDQQDIYELIRDNQDDIVLHYPKSGDYRSAIIMKDLNGNGEDEAISFSSPNDHSGINLKILVKSNDEWTITGEFSSSTTQIDRVCFGDLTGDGNLEIIVGWGSPLSMSAMLNVYKLEGNSVKSFDMGMSYNEMILTDFTGDGILEIFTASIATSSSDSGTASAYARIFSFSRDYVYMAYSTAVNSSVVNYTNIHFETMKTGEAAVLLDGVLSDNSTITQIFTLSTDKSWLVSQLSIRSVVNRFNFFKRPSVLPLTCKDINNDGYYDIPYAVLTAGHTSDISHKSTCYRVDWVNFSPAGSIAHWVRTDIINFDENYSITLPENYAKTIICYNDTEKRELTFHFVSVSYEGKIIASERLFTIKVFSPEAWESKKSDSSMDYTVISNEITENIYTVKQYQHSKLSDELIDSFEIYTD